MPTSYTHISPPTFRITGGAYQNVDEVALTDVSPALINGYVDEVGATNKWPGLQLWKDLSYNYPIQGMFLWGIKNLLIVVANGHTWKITSNKTATDITTVGQELSASKPATFASDGSSLWIATGGKIGYLVNETSNVVWVADGDAPTQVSHVAYLDGYIIANLLGSQKFYFTDPVDRTSWSSLDFATAEAQPDTLQALCVMWKELFLFGSSSVESWYNDGYTPFSPISGAMIENGIGAPYSLVRAGGMLFWLDHRRRLVRLRGRSPEFIKHPFYKVIMGLPDIVDTQAFHVSVEGRSWIIFTFPSAELTLAYDYVLDQWSQIGRWDSFTNSYKKYICGCSIHVDKETYVSYGSTESAEPQTGADVEDNIGYYAWNDPTQIQRYTDDSGTVTSATNNTLTDTSKTWTTNQWANYTVKIISGTGAVQVRTISSNTSNTLTVSGNWYINPYSDSFYRIGQGVGYAGINVEETSTDQTSDYLRATHYLKATNFGFDLPAGANVVGVSAQVKLPRLPSESGSQVKGGASSSGTEWSNKGNLYAEDGNYAYWSGIVGTVSGALIITNFGFSIPPLSVVTGVKVRIRHKAPSHNIRDYTIKLYHGGSAVGSNKAQDAYDWSSNWDNYIYGGSTSTWNISLTPEYVNNAGFGIYIQVKSYAGALPPFPEARIDYVEITVYYSYIYNLPKDYVVKLVVGGNIVGENKATSSVFTNGEIRSYGGPFETWGLTLLDTDVESPDFGLVIACKWDSLDPVKHKTLIRIAVVELTIYYSTSPSQYFSAPQDTLLGSITTGKIYTMSKSFFKEEDSNIRTLRRSGHITYETLKKKKINALNIRLKRNVGNGDEPSPTCVVRWRDDNKSWSNNHEIDIGGIDNPSFTSLKRLGMYSMRQYEIIHDDPTDFVFVEMEEDVEILR
jgi:hypothetical protein